jgi:hypothetical protein
MQRLYPILVRPFFQIHIIDKHRTEKTTLRELFVRSVHVSIWIKFFAMFPVHRRSTTSRQSHYDKNSNNDFFHFSPICFWIRNKDVTLQKVGLLWGYGHFLNSVRY